MQGGSRVVEVHVTTKDHSSLYLNEPLFRGQSLQSQVRVVMDFSAKPPPFPTSLIDLFSVIWTIDQYELGKHIW